MKYSVCTHKSHYLCKVRKVWRGCTTTLRNSQPTLPKVSFTYPCWLLSLKPPPSVIYMIVVANIGNKSEKVQPPKIMVINNTKKNIYITSLQYVKLHFLLQEHTLSAARPKPQDLCLLVCQYLHVVLTQPSLLQLTLKVQIVNVFHQLGPTGPSWS